MVIRKEIIQPIKQVPYYAQFEDAEHIQAYISDKRLLFEDPFWQKSGAATVEDYAYWANRACGMVCVKTCVEALDGPVYPLHTWIKRGLAENAYLTVKRDKTTTIEKGWLHAGLAKVMSNEGLITKVKPASVDEIISNLKAGKLVIASVSFEIGTAQPITQQGGHLVTVVGAVLLNDVLDSLLIHNPSGRTPELREYAAIKVDRFRQSFSGRVIIVGK